MKKFIRDLKSVRLSLSANPYNEPDSEMADNISCLDGVIKGLSKHHDLIEAIKGEIENADLYHSNFILESIIALIEQAKVGGRQLKNES